MKTSFDIKYRQDIIDGKVKLKTRSGVPVKIVCWDRKHENLPIVALLQHEVYDSILEYSIDGTSRFPSDELVIITQESEINEYDDDTIRKELIKLMKKMTDGIIENYTPVSLREFVSWLEKQKSSKWSEEDERIRQCLIKDQTKALDDVKKDRYGHSEIISDLKEMYRERISWLESIKPQSNWKPSDKQMEALDEVFGECELTHLATLCTLYNDLKKLKEK